MTTDDRPPVTDDARAVREAAMNLYRAMRRANPDAWAEVDKVEDWTYWDDIARTAQVTLAAARAETTAEDAEDAVEALAVELFERSHEPSFSDDKRGMDEAREWARRIARDLLATAPTETTTATTEDAARVLTDIEAAVEDYRTVFPTPEPLPPNLDLAVRAARLLARPTPSREDLARTILSAIAQHGEITASQIDGINAAAHAVLDLLEGGTNE